jgi:transcriptional regulator with XRE-family HTH domain
LDRSYLGRIERGEVNVSLLNIERIAGALGASPADFFAAT